MIQPGNRWLLSFLQKKCWLNQTRQDSSDSRNNENSQYFWRYFYRGWDKRSQRTFLLPSILSVTKPSDVFSIASDWKPSKREKSCSIFLPVELAIFFDQAKYWCSWWRFKILHIFVEFAQFVPQVTIVLIGFSLVLLQMLTSKWDKFISRCARKTRTPFTLRCVFFQ